MASPLGCNVRNASKTLIRPRVLVLTMGLLALAGSMALANIHLRFQARDLQIEARRLQKTRAELRNRQKALISKVEGMKNYPWLREYAQTELGLSEFPAKHRRSGMVSAEAIARWEDAKMGFLKTAPSPRRRGGKDILAAMSERVVSLSTFPMRRRSVSDTGMK